MDKASVGTRLRELRESAGFSREELAAKAGLKIGGIRNIEQGIRMPMFDTVNALAAALGVDCTAFTQAPATTDTPGRGRPAKSKPEAEESKAKAEKKPREKPKKKA